MTNPCTLPLKQQIRQQLNIQYENEIQDLIKISRNGYLFRLTRSQHWFHQSDKATTSQA